VQRSYEEEDDEDDYDYGKQSVAPRAAVEQPHAKPKASSKAAAKERARAKTVGGAPSNFPRRDQAGLSAAGKGGGPANEPVEAAEKPSAYASRQQLGKGAAQGGRGGYKQRAHTMSGMPGSSMGSDAGLSNYQRQKQAAGNSNSAGGGASIANRKPGGLGGSSLSQIRSNPSWVTGIGAESEDEIDDQFYH